MKKTFVFVILLILGLSISVTNASSGDTSDVDIPIDSIILHQSRLSGRPNAPARIYIECTYGSGFINFSFPENIHELSVEIYDEDERISGFVTNSFPRMELPELSGNYNITCTTEDNKVFIGLLTF